MHLASVCTFFAFTILLQQIAAQSNIIWNIPNATPKTGSKASISAVFLDSPPTAQFSIYIVASGGDIVDVVVVDQIGGGAAGIWNIPLNFPGGTYQVRVDVVDNALTNSYFAPTTLSVTTVSSSSNCTVAPFQPQTPENFQAIHVILPQAGSLVGLPPVDSAKEGEFNVEYLWKIGTPENGWLGATSLFIDILAINDASLPAGNQVPTATVAHTSVAPPTVSSTTAPIVIPTMAAIKNFLGPAAVRINYTIGTGAMRSAYSQNFFLGRGCNGKIIGEGNSNSTFTSPGSSPGITIKTGDSVFIGIIAGAVAGAIVLTLLVVFLVLWLRRRRVARRRADADKY